jgi:hypothetical protein
VRRLYKSLGVKGLNLTQQPKCCVVGTLTYLLTPWSRVLLEKLTSLCRLWVHTCQFKTRRVDKLKAGTSTNLICTGVPPYPPIQYPRFQLSAVYRGPPKN